MDKIDADKPKERQKQQFDKKIKHCYVHSHWFSIQMSIFFTILYYFALCYNNKERGCILKNITGAYVAEMFEPLSVYLSFYLFVCLCVCVYVCVCVCVYHNLFLRLKLEVEDRKILDGLKALTNMTRRLCDAVIFRLTNDIQKLYDLLYIF